MAHQARRQFHALRHVDAALTLPLHYAKTYTPSPGTTYGAKLHVISSAPRRLAVETTLSEIVVDDAHRLACPLGVKLTGRTLTLIADKQRLLTLQVP